MKTSDWRKKRVDRKRSNAHSFWFNRMKDLITEILSKAWEGWKFPFLHIHYCYTVPQKGLGAKILFNDRQQSLLW